MTKVQYEAPQLRVHGSVEALTEMMTIGTKLDNGFIAGTPLNEVTLS